MKQSKRTIALAAAALAVAGGGGAALAASDRESSSPTAFFDAVAEHLGISSEKLRDATKAAAIDQVDAARKEGRITEEQAAELKQRIEEGDYPLLFGPPLFGGFQHHHGFGFAGKLDAAAGYLDLTEAQLRERLEGGQSLADIARAEDKSVDGLEQAIVDDAKDRLDQAVEDEKLTRGQADEFLERLRSHVDEIVNASFEGRSPGRFEPLPHRAFFPGANA
jgi:hypothetical protein